MIATEAKNSNLHIERLAQRYQQESLLIASGSVYQTISQQLNPVSDVELAMHLNISIPLVRTSLLELERDGLVEQSFKGEWEVAF